MRRLFEIGGVVAAGVLIAFGIVALVMGINGHNTVGNSITQEQITGSPDMTPAAIAPAVKEIQASQAKLAALAKQNGMQFTATEVTAPTGSVAGELVNNGDRARTFAQYMRIHTL